MNEVIKDLMDEANIFENRYSTEEFAQLVIKSTINEMIQQLWNYGIDESNNPSFYKAVYATKKTFGVE